MRVLNKDEFYLEYDKLIQRIKEGAVFIHPTDTIYGIGCNATNEAAVQKVRAIKGRNNRPFSVMIPNKKWITDNCVVNEDAVKYIEELPGALTLILKLKNKKAVAPSVVLGEGSVGVRIPKHWVRSIASGADCPIVTTSANKTGEVVMSSLDDLSPEIKAQVEFIIFEGEKRGMPSKLVDLSKKETKEIARK